MKKVILSLSFIAILGSIAIGATTAYFKDVETSAGKHI